MSDKGIRHFISTPSFTQTPNDPANRHLFTEDTAVNTRRTTTKVPNAREIDINGHAWSSAQHFFVTDFRQTRGEDAEKRPPILIGGGQALLDKGIVTIELADGQTTPVSRGMKLRIIDLSEKWVVEIDQIFGTELGFIMNLITKMPENDLRNSLANTWVFNDEYRADHQGERRLVNQCICAIHQEEMERYFLIVRTTMQVLLITLPLVDESNKTKVLEGLFIKQLFEGDYWEKIIRMQDLVNRTIKDFLETEVWFFV